MRPFLVGTLALMASGSLASTTAELCVGECAAEDGNSMLQLRSRSESLPQQVVEMPHSGQRPTDRKGERVADMGGQDAQQLVDFFFDTEPQDLPAAGSHCKDGVLDCFDDKQKKRCPEACEIKGEMLSMLRGRGHDVPRARRRFVSRLQSRFERRYKEKWGEDKHLPGWHHDALKALEDALDLIAKCEPEKKQAHITSLGYPLTVVEAIMFQLNLTDILVNPPRSLPNSQLYLNFAEIVEQKGWDSPEAREFYERGIYLGGEGVFPVDAGWIDKWIANLRVYSEGHGIHTYRKVPFKLFPPSYDMSYSVYKLPDTKPLKIGVVGDWASGSPQALQLLQEMKKQNVDMVIHLGDTYYSGTVEEQRQFFLEPMRAVFGEHIPVLNMPGNHDYYDGGKGFYDVIDDIGVQEASYFCLRGKHHQILALDTGLLDNFDLLFNVGISEIDTAMTGTMTFLTDDQLQWAHHQLKVGKEKGLKTIMMSHHQLFSRAWSMGVPNAMVEELSTVPDRLAFTYYTNEFSVPAEKLPGGLPNNASYPVNTRLLSQFPAELLQDVEAWFWGHEHSSQIFGPYAGLKRGRCIGNGAIPVAYHHDPYAEDPSLDTAPWGGPAPLLPGTKVKRGDAFWAIGFTTLEFSGTGAVEAKYFQMQDSYKPPNAPTWSAATEYFTEMLN